MLHLEMFGHQPVFGIDQVGIAIMRELAAQSVAGLRRSTAADAVRQDDEIFRRIERLPGPEQFTGKRRTQPVLAVAAGAVQQHDAVDDFARGIALLRPERGVMDLEFGHRLAARETVVLEDVIAVALVGPRSWGSLRRGLGNDWHKWQRAKKQGGHAGADDHGVLHSEVRGEDKRNSAERAIHESYRKVSLPLFRTNSFIAGSGPHR